MNEKCYRSEFYAFEKKYFIFRIILVNNSIHSATSDYYAIILCIYGWMIVLLKVCVNGKKYFVTLLHFSLYISISNSIDIFIFLSSLYTKRPECLCETTEIWNEWVWHKSCPSLRGRNSKKKKSVQPFSCEMRWRHGDRWFKDDVVNFWLCDSKSPTKLIRYYKDPACFNWNILQFSSFSRKILLLAIQ